jgi:hypothetical protein
MSMKALVAVLTVIAVILAVMLWKLGQMRDLLESSGQNTQSIVASNQAVIVQMQKLGTSFDSLRQEIADFKDKMLKR